MDALQHRYLVFKECGLPMKWFNGENVTFVEHVFLITEEISI